MKPLTRPKHKAILNPLSEKTKARTLNPESKGVKTPIQGVFYCPEKMVAPMVRPSILVARIGPLRSGPVPLPGVENPLRVAAQNLSTFGGGYQPSVKEQPL